MEVNVESDEIDDSPVENNEDLPEYFDTDGDDVPEEMIDGAYLSEDTYVDDFENQQEFMMRQDTELDHLMEYEGESYNEAKGEDSNGSDNNLGSVMSDVSQQQSISGHIREYDYGDDDANWDKDDEVVDSTIDISKLENLNKEQAREIALVIIEMLEDDVGKYLEQQGIVPDSENYDEYGRLKEVKESKRKLQSGSSVSIDSTFSLDEDQPSTMRLFYDKGESIFREISITNIPEGEGVDEETQVTLHRNPKLFGKKQIIMKEAETQTKVTALVTKEVGERIFWKLYPKPDDWKAPGIPSRQNSMMLAVEKADVDKDENVDKPEIKPQIKRSIKKRILKPLPEDYSREQTFWTGSRFKGEYRNRQFHLGHFDFATGTTYDSEFKNGHAHSRKHTGLLIYPRGDTYEGQWRKGHFQAGKIIFADGLEYEPRNWNYCQPPDRRFKSEKIIGVHAAGNTTYNDRFPPTEIQKLPVGCFDVGEGIYDPNTSSITGYDGAYLRTVTEYEHDWIVKNCRKQMYPWERYTPKFHEDRLPGSSCEKRPCNKF